MFPPWVWRLPGTDLRRIPAFSLIALRHTWRTSNLSGLLGRELPSSIPSPISSLLPPLLIPNIACVRFVSVHIAKHQTGSGTEGVRQPDSVSPTSLRLFDIYLHLY